MPALSGMKILDLTQFEAGPACTQALAWLGAHVVKVELPGRGDRSRGPDNETNQAYAPLFCAWNANKHSLALDIATEEGREVFLRLVSKFDVLIENFGPGVIERLRVDYEALRPIAPQLIFARIKGFGATGPYASFPCQQPISQAAAGAFSINGERNGPPMLPGPMGDASAGIYAAVVILAAWAQRQRTGEGQQLDISMQEAMTFFVRGRAAIGSRFGTRATRRAGNSGDIPPGGLYACKPFGENDYIYLMPTSERQWGNLCEAMDRPELRTDLRFYSVRWRIQNHQALRDEISAWTHTLTKFEAFEALGAVGVPCGPCLDTAELLRDPHLTQRGFIEEIELPVHGALKVPGFAPRMSESHVPLTRPPRLGEHTDDVLVSELGLDEDQLNDLKDARVITDSSQAY